MKNKLKCYLAAGWFNPQQDEDLTKLESILDERADWIDLASPRRIFICPPNAPQDVQNNTFQGNLEHIKTADFMLASTMGKDTGALWEMGYAYANNIPIVYVCAGLPAGAKFNLMLAKSGISVHTTYESLESYLDRCKDAEKMLIELYEDSIE